MVLNDGLFRNRQGIVDKRKAEGFANILAVELTKSCAAITEGIAKSKFSRSKSEVAAGTINMGREADLNEIANAVQKANEELERLPYLSAKNYPDTKLVEAMEKFRKYAVEQNEVFYTALLNNPDKYPSPQSALKLYGSFVDALAEELKKMIGLDFGRVIMKGVGT